MGNTTRESQKSYEITTPGILMETTTVIMDMFFFSESSTSAAREQTTQDFPPFSTLDSACQNGSSHNSSVCGDVVTPRVVPLNSNMPFWECTYSRWLFMIAMPIFQFFGVFGNTMAFCVMMRMQMRKSSVCMCLAGIALADNIFFTLQSLRSLLLNVTFASWDLRVKMRCGIYQFLWGVSSEMSTLTLTAVTLERVLAVYNPLKAPLWFTVKRAKISMLVFCILLSAWNFPLLLVYKTATYKDIIYCTADVPAWYYMAYNIIDAIIYSYGPFLCIFISNILLVWKLRRRGEDLERPIETAIPSSSLRAHGKGFKKAVNDKILPMLIMASTVFLLTTGPASILAMLRVCGVPLVIHMDEEGHCNTMVAAALPVVLMISNHGINFYLYSISGKTFRSEFLSMIGVKESSKKQSSGDSKTTKDSGGSRAVYNISDTKF